MRKQKENRDFTIYAKNSRIQDSSFEKFKSSLLDPTSVLFNLYGEINEATNQRKDNVGAEEVKLLMFANLSNDPTSFNEAMNTRDKLDWQNAIAEELNSMKENEVWVLVDRPNKNQVKVIDSKWVFKRKLDEDGKTTFKARLVIRGFKDSNEYELREIYAPVSRLAIVRTALAIINKENLEACQMDVKTAFLNGTLEETIYMELPEGVEVDSETRKKKVCKLQKSLYGLKVSPKRWNVRFTEEVAKLGFQNNTNEPCLFTWREKGKSALIVLYVDDMLIASNNKDKLEEIKSRLSRIFKMKDLGEPRVFLGMKITRDRKNRKLTITQEDYIEKILHRFNLENCNPVRTPMVTKQVRKQAESKEKEGPENELKVPYREAIGSLLYLANVSRPDILYPVNFLARKQLIATNEDWADVVRVFQYIRGTSNLGLTYKAKGNSLEALTDSSFCDNANSISTCGYY